MYLKNLCYRIICKRYPHGTKDIRTRMQAAITVAIPILYKDSVSCSHAESEHFPAL
ncbi:hypothetical protein HMPREF1989_01831 [Porphyromonas gingivalis F0566]|nr:hypothetical protein HMPREF1989_01831 [Porphyromonas gingivalis F0566]